MRTTRSTIEGVGVPAASAPPLSGASAFRAYYDTTTGELMISTAGGPYAGAVVEGSSPTFAALNVTGSAAVGSLSVADNANLWTSQGGGWRDMVGDLIARGVGPTNPTWAQMAASPFWGYDFGLNDQIWVDFHIRHDYTPASDIYLHAHWTTDGVDVNPVRWEFTWSYAKGHNQGNFNVAGTVVTVEQATNGTAWRHMISEIAVPISSVDFEVDGIIMCRIRRVTNGAVDNADAVFLRLADCHYQANTFATKNRAPNFYT